MRKWGAKFPEEDPINELHCVLAQTMVMGGPQTPGPWDFMSSQLASQAKRSPPWATAMLLSSYVARPAAVNAGQ